MILEDRFTGSLCSGQEFFFKIAFGHFLVPSCKQEHLPAIASPKCQRLEARLALLSGLQQCLPVMLRRLSGMLSERRKVAGFKRLLPLVCLPLRIGQGPGCELLG